MRKFIVVMWMKEDAGGGGWCRTAGLVLVKENLLIRSSSFHSIIVLSQE